MNKFNIMIIIFITVITIIFPSQANAQTPSSWQQSATGLRLQTISYPQVNRPPVIEKKTAGLSMHVTDKGWPSLSLQGGVTGGSLLEGPIGIDLGEVSIPNQTATLDSETANWSSNQLSFNSGNFKVWASRLTSAVLLQNTSPATRLFSGTIRRHNFNGSQVSELTPGPSSPKWVAYSTGGTIQVSQLTTAPLNLPALDNNWILVWYGNSTHFVDTKKPLSYSVSLFPYYQITLPASNAYRADAPMLLTFQNNPSSIVQSSAGGIELNSTGGYISVLPIFGREHLRASDTESWGTSGALPGPVLSKVNFWAQRSCNFPSNAAEGYSYDNASDIATITDTFTFIPVCSAASKFAPVAPMLGIAKDAFGANLTFSGSLVDGNLPTEFGPTFGIDNTTTYSWSLKGLKNYTDNRRSVGSSAAPQGLLNELVSQVDKITAGGHFAPWLFGDHTPTAPGFCCGSIYWNNPADIIYHLTEVVPVLPEPQKTQLINYITQEKTRYPPETVYDLPLNQGKFREGFAESPNSPWVPRWRLDRDELFLKRVPLYNFYALSNYFDTTQESVADSVLVQARSALNADMQERDWATFYPFKGFATKRVPVENVHRQIAGLIGLSRLAQIKSDAQTDTLAKALLAKESVLRIALAKYPRYLYSSNITDISGFPADWMLKQVKYPGGGNTNYGYIYNLNWVGPNDDHRQVLYLNQFEAFLYDHSGHSIGQADYYTGVLSPYLISYKDMVPEAARILSDYAKSESLIELQKVENYLPNWYMAFSEAILGNEHGLNHPVDSFGMFLAKAIIQNDSAANLEKYIDIPWLTNGGDLFYVHKLAETVRAYKGGTGGPIPTSAPTSAPSPTGGGGPLPTATPTPTPAGLSISNIIDNKSNYTNSQVPAFEKLEVTFNINNTVATNLQLPYDTNPPPGLSAGQGVTVNAEFSQDNFTTKVTQPAFYYQDFDYQVKGGQEWFYPKNQYSWKVRFAPTNTGTWQYRITAQDISGTTTSGVQQFTVAANPNNHGFIKVSQRDRRYFEYDDGTYFPGLSINATWNELDWDNPVTKNQAYLQKLGQNGIQLIRNWISDWGIYSSDDSPWNSVRGGANDPGVAVPHVNGVPVPAYGGADVAFQLERFWNPCQFYGGWHDQPSGSAVKRNSAYKIFIRYVIPQPLAAPVDSTKPNGLGAKLSGWLDPVVCAQSGQGIAITPFVNQISTKDAQGNWQWQILEGTIPTSYTSNKDFLQRLYLVMENIDHSTSLANPPVAGEKILVERVEIREDTGNCQAAAGAGSQFDLSNGSCGINIMTSPSSAFHQYFNQKFSLAFDKTLDLAKQNDVYLKLVGLEKNEYIQNHIGYLGNPVRDGQSQCTGVNYLDANPANGCPGNYLFYGNLRNMTKTRWLQQAWWRYLQARWGYSTNIHSWELLNEGDPNSTAHYTLADEFGKYMHQFANSHLVTTSNWFSFPASGFWGNSQYQNLDYADVHEYVADNTALGQDTALASETQSKLRRNQLTATGFNKPIIRGEIGFTDPSSTDIPTPLFNNDTQGIWLHKFNWAQLNSGGLVESYWHAKTHIFGSRDLRPLFLPVYNFLKNIPLNNGNYVDVGAIASDLNVRVFGQKDRVLGRAHMWIDNKTHTWNNVVTSVAATPATGTVTFPGMPAGSYDVSWIDPYSLTGSVIKSEVVTALAGNIVLTLPQTLSTDIAVKVSLTTAPLPTPGPSTCTLNPGTWSTNSAIQGNQVTLNISATGAGCSGKQVALSISKNGIFGGPAASGPVPTLVTLSPSGLANAAWTAEYVADLLSPLGPNQYYFNSTLQGGVAVQSALLDVSPVPAGGPAPTPTLTPTRIPSPTPSQTGPTSTPTPIPVCNITSATWGTTSASEGDVVTLNITGNNNCSGKGIKFDVFEDDLSFPLFPAQGDETVGRNPSDAIFNGNTATTYWTTEWQNDCSGLCNPPEYYFNAFVISGSSGGSGIAFKSTNQLSVNRGSFNINKGPNVQTDNSTAVITWDTDNEASTRVDYGVSSQYIGSVPLTGEADTAPRVRTHTITIPNLRACTEYLYRVQSRDAAGNTVARGDKFQTSGCPGGSNIQGNPVSALIAITGGLLNFLNTTRNTNLTLDIPNQYHASAAYFQIKQLEKDKVVLAQPVPAGKVAAGDNIYRLDALTSPSSSVGSFSNTLKVTVDYNLADIQGIDPQSLRIYRFDGTTWQELSNCLVDTTAQTVTCETSLF